MEGATAIKLLQKPQSEFYIIHKNSQQICAVARELNHIFCPKGEKKWTLTMISS